MTKSFHITAPNGTAPPAGDQNGRVGVGSKATNVGVQISGTWVATLQFEGTVDGVNWVAIAAVPAAGGAAVTTTGANGAWTIDGRGFTAVRVQATAFTSGDAIVVFEPALE